MIVATVGGGSKTSRHGGFPGAQIFPRASCRSTETGPLKPVSLLAIAVSTCLGDFWVAAPGVLDSSAGFRNVLLCRDQRQKKGLGYGWVGVLVKILGPAKWL